jgi:uncharacterized membrane protein YfcA
LLNQPSRKNSSGDFPIQAVTFLVVAVVFVATLIRSAIGFGEALIAVPLLAFFIPVRVAAPAQAATHCSCFCMGTLHRKPAGPGFQVS